MKFNIKSSPASESIAFDSKLSISTELTNSTYKSTVQLTDTSFAIVKNTQINNVTNNEDIINIEVSSNSLNYMYLNIDRCKLGRSLVIASDSGNYNVTIDDNCNINIKSNINFNGNTTKIYGAVKLEDLSIKSITPTSLVHNNQIPVGVITFITCDKNITFTLYDKIIPNFVVSSFPRRSNSLLFYKNEYISGNGFRLQVVSPDGSTVVSSDTDNYIGGDSGGTVDNPQTPKFYENESRQHETYLCLAPSITYNNLPVVLVMRIN